MNHQDQVPNEEMHDPRPQPQYGEYAPTEDQRSPISGASPEVPEPSGRRPAEVPQDRPQYGEYAPEGWNWKPPGDEGNRSDAVESSAPSQTPPSGWAAGSSAGPLPGVPHNLGADAGAISETPAASTPPASTPPQYAATPPPRSSAPDTNAPPQQQPQATQPYRAAPPQNLQPYGATPYPPQAAMNRGGDRIATILLLVFGALGALYLAASLYQMPASIAMVGTMLGSESLAVPESVTTLGIVGAILLLSLYALTLIYSLQRLRARKLAFWVPLAAGALAMVLTFIFTMIGMTQVPELMTLLSDPNSTANLLGSQR